MKSLSDAADTALYTTRRSEAMSSATGVEMTIPFSSSFDLSDYENKPRTLT
ncbi:hypothetical protein [Ruminococcus sp.]|uniref:hypothetical protein n=1 Tax=Ruminococcus sp. TaxID=41978 RepID=UPI0025F2F0E9|nr:hypothetical protein [Ruminococcus sp.]